jgi:hypothetical protein
VIKKLAGGFAVLWLSLKAGKKEVTSVRTNVVWDFGDFVGHCDFHDG